MHRNGSIGYRGGCRAGKGSLDNAAAAGFMPDPSQKLRADVFRHRFRVSENVSHDGGFLGYLKKLAGQRIIDSLRMLIAQDGSTSRVSNAARTSHCPSG